MPASDWNGKFQGVGGGGFAGVISYGAMVTALGRGYATASTDTGHNTPGGSWALNRPDLILDYAYRAIHEMTVKSKQIVEAFYGNGPRLSYFVGCSTGGRQGLDGSAALPHRLRRHRRRRAGELLHASPGGIVVARCRDVEG